VLEVNIGDCSKTVVSGIAEWQKPDGLVGKVVVLIVNVKPGDLDGVNSSGRVLVATAADGKTKELVLPPAEAKVGERIFWKGLEGKAPDVPSVSGKHFHDIMKTLHTSSSKTVQSGDLDFLTSAGPCTVPTIANGTVA